MSTYDERKTPAEAWRFATTVMADFGAVGARRPLVMGSLRRWPSDEAEQKVVGDLDLIIVADVEETLTGPRTLDLTEMSLPGYLKVTAKKAHGWRSLDGHGRMMVDAWLCPIESVGPFAFFLTGPPELNVVMRQISQQAGLMLTQYGLFEPVPAPTKTYPDRVRPGRRVDDAPASDALTVRQREEVFWDDWCEAVGLKNGGCPQPHQRREVMRWLQGRSRATGSTAATTG